MVIDDKGGERQRYEIVFGYVMTKGMREYGHNQEGAKMEGSQFLDKEKHTSRGSKLMNLIDCI